MHISWHGQYTIKMQTRDTVVIIDPYSPELGLRPFRSQANIVALTNHTAPAMSHIDSIQGEPAVLSGPGEFTLSGFTLHAIPWRAPDSTERSIQRWLVEGMCVVNLGSLSRALTDSELQEIEKTDIDVLFIPAGGGDSLSSKDAAKLVTTLEPRMVIPIHVAVSGLKEKLEPAAVFGKEFGLKSSQGEKKIIVKGNRLPKDEMQVTILAP